MKKRLENQIQEIAQIINHIEDGDIDVDSLMGMDELLDLLSSKIKSTKLGNPLYGDVKRHEAERHEAIFIFDSSFKVYKYTGIFDHLFYPEKNEKLEVTDLLKIEDSELFSEQVKRLIETRKNQELETIIHSAQEIPLSATICLELISEKAGEELILAGVNFANTTLSDIKDYQQIVIENLPGIDVYLFDKEYRYVLAGGREKERFGLTNSYFAGKTLFEAFDEKVSKRLFPFYHKALNGEMADGEIRIEDQVYYIWATPVGNFNDQVVGGTAIVQNVTKDKEIELRLKKAKNDAQEAEKAKSTFLASMSHEIRTPLNAIVGFSEQLNNTQLNKKQEKFVRLINDSSEHLLSLVNEILVLFKLGMGKVFIDEIPFSLTRILNVIYNSFIIRANEKRLQFFIYIDPEIPETIVGDPFRIRQVIINLVSNALKYTDEGRVDLRCLLQKGGPDEVCVRFEVEDTGVGIAADLLPSIFDEFTQSSSQPDKKRKGVGLGLTICKKMVELMDGNIRVNSEEGKGSLFHFTIPFKKATGKEALDNETHFFLKENLLQGKKILFADDDEYNLLLAETVLTNWEADFKLARNGEEALDNLLATRYDIILLDIHMPKLTGVEVIQEVRKNKLNPNYKIKALAVTANVVKSDVKRYMDEGFDGYVLKPFKEHDLYNKICNVLKLGSSTGVLEEPEEMVVKQETGNEDQLDFDTHNLWVTANGDKMFFNKMIDTFLKNTTVMLENLELALSKEDWKAVGEIAHKGIPSFTYFSLARVVEKLKHLEDLALRSEEFDDVPSLCKDVVLLVNEVIKRAENAKL
ncbi:ATP-binding protein [uncultured Sunxiuqinia sp.]|uniref:ATP-binding protein n=1 Tax=uncultured Sunxiuqinia sp. TaxID=1573825 RepID=UPI002AA8467A|nr:ATP-binding protein [uncultured Sunxiuqinia sp.]